jgi:hypothetical protein
VGKLVAALALCSAFALPVGHSQNQPKSPMFLIRRPTVIAFFPPVTEKELKGDPDTNEALADFQEYTSRVRAPLMKLGVNFKEVYASSFRVTVSGKTSTFRPGAVGVGYYFVAPGNKPRVEYGVNTDIGIISVAKEYFGISPQ